MINVLTACNGAGVPVQMYPVGTGTPPLPRFESAQVIVQAGSGNTGNVLLMPNNLTQTVPANGTSTIRDGAISLAPGASISMGMSGDRIALSAFWVSGAAGNLVTMLATQG